MMNIMQVQDDLKNFSQEQLIKEIQRPSGMAPQFLVLSEINRNLRTTKKTQQEQPQTKKHKRRTPKKTQTKKRRTP